MTQYKFDALRYCLNNTGRMHLPDGSDPMARIAEELRMAMELREAVAWEREHQAFTYRAPLSIDTMKELLRTRYAAHAEVDRLLNEGAADCKGEG